MLKHKHIYFCENCRFAWRFGEPYKKYNSFPNCGSHKLKRPKGSMGKTLIINEIN